MKLDPGIHIVMHSVLSLKPCVTSVEATWPRHLLVVAWGTVIAVGSAWALVTLDDLPPVLTTEQQKCGGCFKVPCNEMLGVT